MVLFLINILPSLIRSHHFLSPAAHICELCCIRPYLDSKTASTISASTVHSKLDYCNSVYHNLPKYKVSNKLPPADSELSCMYCG